MSFEKQGQLQFPANRYPVWLFVLICAVGFVIRAGVMSAHPECLTQDLDVYLGIARGIAQGTGFCTPGTSNPTAFRPPLYPVVLAGGISLFPEPIAVASLNLLFSLVIVGGTVWLANNLTRDFTVTTLAGALVSCDPLLVATVRYPMTETLSAALLVLTLVAMTWRDESYIGSGCVSSFTTGVLFGLSALCRPAGYAWFAVFLVLEGFGRWWWGWLKGERLRQSLIDWTILTLGLMSMVAVWGGRNWYVFGEWTLATTHGGYTLHLGNNQSIFDDEVSSFGQRTWSSSHFENWTRQWQLESLQELNEERFRESAVDRWHQSRAMSWIRRNPREFLISAFYREFRLLSLLPPGDHQTSQILGWCLVLWYAVLWILVVLGAVQLIYQPGKGLIQQRVYLAIMASVVSTAGVHLFYFANARMRASIVPALFLLAAVGARDILRNIYKKTGSIKNPSGIDAAK